MSNKDDRTSLSSSTRAALVLAYDRFVKSKSAPPKWVTDNIKRLRAGPTKSGRPEGTGIDDERHCIEMAKLILQGKAQSEYVAARLVSAKEAPHLRDAAIDRRRKKYPRNKSDYIAQAKRELGLAVN